MTPDSQTYKIIESLGFKRGTGFKGEVWTNGENIHVSQVWIYFSGSFPERFSDAYDARSSFDLKSFFEWWCVRSADELAFAQRGDER